MALKNPTTLVELEQALKDATAEHNRCLNLEAEARRNSTATLNSLNAAQKAFDEHVARMRGQAPRGSDWNLHHRSPVEMAG
jgi:hypothetical protein